MSKFNVPEPDFLDSERRTSAPYLDFTLPTELDRQDLNTMKIKYETQDDEFEKEFERLFNDNAEILANPLRHLEEHSLNFDKEIVGFEDLELEKQQHEIQPTEKTLVEKELMNEIQESIQFECDFDKSLNEDNLGNVLTPESPEHKPFQGSFSSNRKEIDIEELYGTINQLKVKIMQLEQNNIQSESKSFVKHISTQTNDETQVHTFGQNENQTVSDMDSVESAKLKNTINSLESKILVLERRLEYSQFVQKMAEEERDKLLSQLNSSMKYQKQKNLLTEDSSKMNGIPSRSYDTYHSEGKSMKDEYFATASINNFKGDFYRKPELFSSGRDDILNENIIPRNSQSQLFEKNVDKFIPSANNQKKNLEFDKQQVKQELKRSFMESMRKKSPKRENVFYRSIANDNNYSHYGRNREVRAPSPVKVTLGLSDTNNDIPFVVGTSTSPSHNLNSNLQMIKALIKQLDGEKVSSEAWSLDQLRTLLKELEIEYDHFSKFLRNLESGLRKGSVETSSIDRVKKELRFMKQQSEKIRLMIKARENNTSQDQIQYIRSPSKALLNLCKLRSLQKMAKEVRKANGISTNDDILSSPSKRLSSRKF